MSTSCRSFSVDLSAFYDNELEGDELTALEAHLKTCDPCSRELKKMGKLSEVITRVSDGTAVKKPLFEEIMNRLAEDGGHPAKPGGKNLVS